MYWKKIIKSLLDIYFKRRIITRIETTNERRKKMNDQTIELNELDRQFVGYMRAGLSYMVAKARIQTSLRSNYIKLDLFNKVLRKYSHMA